MFLKEVSNVSFDQKYSKNRNSVYFFFFFFFVTPNFWTEVYDTDKY